jgi:hypothetical protein
MKSMFNQVLLLVTGMFLSLNVPAQTTNAGPDSVAFKYKGFGSGRFTFSDGGTKEIAMIDKGAELVYYKKTSLDEIWGIAP